MNELAPVILFAYQRLDHLSQVIEALKNNPEAKNSHLIVYSDAGKNEESVKRVEEVREYLRYITGFSKITVIEQVENQGIEKSENQGITQVLNEYGKAIILEDDIVVGKQFLGFMNKALIAYKDHKKVYSITGYSFLNDEDIISSMSEFAFIQLTSAWGWATWKDRWDTIKPTIERKELRILNNKNIRRDFDYGYSYAHILLKQYMNQYYTWDFLWYWTSFVNNGVTLVPAKTMVNNIGMDGSGVHYTDKSGMNRIEELNAEYVMQFPNKVEEDLEVKNAVMKRLKKNFPVYLSSKIKRIIYRRIVLLIG